MKTRIFGQASGKLVSVLASRRVAQYSELLAGFMKHLPNLLKQESSSASTLVHVLLRMYYDTRSEHQAARPQVMDRLMP